MRARGQKPAIKISPLSNKEASQSVYENAWEFPYLNESFVNHLFYILTSFDVLFLPYFYFQYSEDIFLMSHFSYN